MRPSRSTLTRRKVCSSSTKPRLNKLDEKLVSDENEVVKQNEQEEELVEELEEELEEELGEELVDELEEEPGEELEEEHTGETVSFEYSVLHSNLPGLGRRVDR